MLGKDYSPPYIKSEIVVGVWREFRFERVKQGFEDL